MRIGSTVILIWLVIGVFAAAQRGYFGGTNASCTRVGTIALTVVAGPLNYVGANPRVACRTPRPSR